MYQRFRRSCFGTFGLLLLCTGCAILGTWVADFFIRQQGAARRNAQTVPQMPAFDTTFLFSGMNMDPHLSISIGSSGSTGGLISSTMMNPSLVSFMMMPPLPMGAAKKMPIGSVAPDFTLADAIDQHEVRLADFRGQKPVVLLFGSFGCDVFCGQLDRLNKLHRAYQDRVEFLFVYIKEAPHKNLIPPPTGAEKNLGRIPRGLRHFKIAFSCLLGNKKVESDYTPFPLRLVIIDRTGRIAMDAGVGIPSGWNLDRLESLLKQI